MPTRSISRQSFRRSSPCGTTCGLAAAAVPMERWPAARPAPEPRMCRSSGRADHFSLRQQLADAVRAGAERRRQLRQPHRAEHAGRAAPAQSPVRPDHVRRQRRRFDLPLGAARRAAPLRPRRPAAQRRLYAWQVDRQPLARSRPRHRRRRPDDNRRTHARRRPQLSQRARALGLRPAPRAEHRRRLRAALRTRQDLAWQRRRPAQRPGRRVEHLRTVHLPVRRAVHGALRGADAQRLGAVARRARAGREDCRRRSSRKRLA